MKEDMQIKYMKSACYYANTRIGNFSDFFNNLNSPHKFDQSVFDSTIGKDCKIIMKTLNDNKIYEKINKFYTSKGYIDNYHIILHEAQKIFNTKIDVPLFLVESLIEPFNSRDCDSISIDKEDSIKIGLPYGIYYVKKYLTHVYFEFIVAHELIHQFISVYSEYVPYTSLMEEGFCDLLAVILLNKCKLFDIKVIKNILLYNRYLSNGIVWKHYLCSFKFACKYTVKYGLEGSINLLKSGRNKIKNISLEDIKLNSTNIGDFDVSVLLSEIYDLDFYFTIDIIDYYILFQLVNDQNTSIEEKYRHRLNTLSNSGLICFSNNEIYIQDSTYYHLIRYIIDD